MLLYHGSAEVVKKPEIRKGEIFLDFGIGFYTTTSYEQAERWAKRKIRRNNLECGWVSIYEFDFELLNDELIIQRFPAPDETWLNFVLSCRKGNDFLDFADLHIGPVVNDNIYQTIRLFETGAYDAEYTIKKLKSEVFHDQWTFHTEKSLSHLHFIDSKEITRGSSYE